jgi:intraflagellar transport protein 20
MGGPTSDQKLITFDDEFRLRVLETAKYDASTTFRDNCELFDTRVDELQDMADAYAKALQKASKCVEAEKLRAIGIRNRVAALREQRSADESELCKMKAEKQKLLDSLSEEAKSLQLVIDDQGAQIARLQGMSAG